MSDSLSKFQDWQWVAMPCRGHFGEVWRAVRHQRADARGTYDGGGGDRDHFVLKRLMVEQGMEVSSSDDLQ